MVTFWPRVNTLLLVLLVLMAGAIITMLATRAYGGPLDPPGPPGATDGVRLPGTPISSLPFAISQPGYYYVTRNLTGGAGQGGITIASSNVTLDLGGFTLFGGATPGDGISANGPRYAIVRNGSVRGWSNGINLVATYSRVERVQVSSNLFRGIAIGGGSEISDCIVSLNGTGGGIYSGSFVGVRNCTFAENAGTSISVGSGSLVEGNRVNFNPGAYSIELLGDNATARNNELSGNVGDIAVYGTGNVIMGNVYCSLFDFGTNTVITGNVDRVNAC